MQAEAFPGIKIRKRTITGTNINLAKLGTVPSAKTATTANSATTATTATTAGTANALAALEPVRFVGTPGQPPFLDGSNNITEEGPFKFAPAGFYKDHEGIVHLTGAAKIGTEGQVKGLIFTLPPGYRPASRGAEVFLGLEKLSVLIFGSNEVIEGQDLSGDVFTIGGEAKGVVLSGITFRAES